MQLRHAIVVSMVWFLSCVGIANGQEIRRAGNDQYAGPVTTWMGSNGNIWHFRTDESKRLISFKRVGSKGKEIQYLYENDSRKPVAARLAGQQWQRKKMSFGDQGDSTSQCSGDQLNMGSIPKVLKTAVSPSYAQINTQISQLSKPRFQKAYYEQIDQTGYDDAMATYMDLQLMMQDYYNQWDMFIRTPEERRKCIDYCNDLTDLAWLTCAGFGFLGPGGVAVGFVCGFYFYDKRAECRDKCAL